MAQSSTKAGVTTGPSEAASVYDEARELGLLPNLGELDAFGYTIVPPEKAQSEGLVEPLLRRITELTVERTGVQPDFETGATHGDMSVLGQTAQSLYFLMAAGREFEQALLNPVLLTLVRYLMGDDFVLSSAIGALKGPGDFPLFLHSDQVIHPSPRSLVCNVHYLLSDYSKENGATCFVPGSHKLMRQPTASENFRFETPLAQAPNNGLFGAQFEAQARRRAGEALEIVEPPKVVPIEAPKGSLLIWHGNTWHGSFPRTNPGLRANFSMLFCNIWLRPHEAYLECLPQEVLDRNGERFADLIGRKVSVGYTSEGPDYKPGGVFENTRKRVNANAFDA